MRRTARRGVQRRRERKCRDGHKHALRLWIQASGWISALGIRLEHGKVQTEIRIPGIKDLTTSQAEYSRRQSSAGQGVAIARRHPFTHAHKLDPQAQSYMTENSPVRLDQAVRAHDGSMGRGALGALSVWPLGSAALAPPPNNAGGVLASHLLTTMKSSRNCGASCAQSAGSHAKLMPPPSPCSLSGSSGNDPVFCEAGAPRVRGPSRRWRHTHAQSAARRRARGRAQR